MNTLRAGAVLKSERCKRNCAGSTFDVRLELDMQIGMWKEEADQYTVLGYFHQRSRLLLIPLPPDTPDFHICDFL